MRYNNEVCAGCGKKFLKNDDIVVCPECGTPQHRACYEKNNECVNAQLHEAGFMWKGNANPPVKREKNESKNNSENLVCPTCGHVNPPQAPYCEACGQKFTFFGVNILEKEMELAKKDEERAKEEEQAQGGRGGEQDGSFESDENREELPETDIDRMINSRARIIAPGITKAQEQERLCSQPIKRVLVFVSSNSLKYVNKFRKIEAGGKTWNWAAFFFTPYWFFYRKLNKAGLVFLSLRVAISVIMTPFAAKVAEAMQSFSSMLQNNPDMTQAQLQSAMQSLVKSELPMYVFMGILLLISVVSALIGDKLYKKYVTEKLDYAETITEPIMFSQYFLKFGSVNVFITSLAIFIGYMLPTMIAQMLNL